jgi:hypothetical protein
VKPIPNRERSFGLSVGTVLLLIAAVLVWKERMTAAITLGTIGATLVALGATFPRLLKWPSDAWWRMALVLGWINARIILTVAFAVVLTPIGLLWRLIGKDPLARRRSGWPGWTPYPDRYRKADHFTKMY